MNKKEEKGELGVQYYLKSSRAFEQLHFLDSYVPEQRDQTGYGIDQARIEALRFLENRRIQIARRYQVPEITVVDAIANQYVYNQEYGIYERR